MGTVMQYSRTVDLEVDILHVAWCSFSFDNACTLQIFLITMCGCVVFDLCWSVCHMWCVFAGAVLNYF